MATSAGQGFDLYLFVAGYNAHVVLHGMIFDEVARPIGSTKVSK